MIKKNYKKEVARPMEVENNVMLLVGKCEKVIDKFSFLEENQYITCKIDKKFNWQYGDKARNVLQQLHLGRAIRRGKGS